VFRERPTNKKYQGKRNKDLEKKQVVNEGLIYLEKVRTKGRERGYAE